MDCRCSWKLSYITNSSQCERHQRKYNQGSQSSSLNFAAIAPLRPLFMLAPSLAMTPPPPSPLPQYQKEGWKISNLDLLWRGGGGFQNNRGMHVIPYIEFQGAQWFCIFFFFLGTGNVLEKIHFFRLFLELFLNSDFWQSTF